ncbi:MAG TPA: ribonuclease P protein component [Syntrophothermus lipocalidus]|uniref:Ribonuclease P protein component n=1 Tax=Syntrophothermus lipocalidus (strain DSM 12680 / TGB-C1) TaxID=643648 RepID=D7CKD6_SYNLT|nr:ribonuclease P protein component [Syntrophothermus lipocalidus]ADI03120.1 ribonuclease P protein component [Syntrophothermus lipocalidus DSM 12680]HHV76610.1 ribonuclease P protein component [Syntrophothermus lipocalidus]
MLKSDQRLRKRKDFEKVYSKGKKVFGRYLILYVGENAAGKNRYGIVASKKVGKAVIRNKSRRRVREVARTLDSKLRQGYDVIVIVKPLCREADFASVKSDYERLLKRSKLLK